MCAAEMLHEVFASALCHEMNRDTGGVRRNQASLFAVLLYFLEYRFLDVQALNHHLDNPIAISNFGHVIVHIAQAYAAGKACLVQ